VDLLTNDVMKRLREATRLKIEQSERREKLEELTKAIGDRRTRDLVDIIARHESKDGWAEVISLMGESQTSSYPIPLGSTVSSKQIEPLKFREVLFEILGYGGMEAIPSSTNGILDILSGAQTSTEASLLLGGAIEESIPAMVEKGDTLFLDTSICSPSIPAPLSQLIDEAQRNTAYSFLSTIKTQSSSHYDLWYSEIGRRAMVDSGLCQESINHDDIDAVLSVIQSSVREIPSPQLPHDELEKPIRREPTNPNYKELLERIIQCDVQGLAQLGSRYGSGVVDNQLRLSVDQYNSSPNEDSYRRIIDCITYAVGIRSIDSLITLNLLATNPDPRIATPAISAMSNFYHESTVAIIAELICSTRRKQYRELGTAALENLSARCPETKNIIEDYLNVSCRNISSLRRFYRKHWQ
jgi:hypothetical protein